MKASVTGRRVGGWVACLFFCTIMGTVQAQTAADSLAIVSAAWENGETASEGIHYRHALIDNLYHGPQSINVIEIDPQKGWKGNIAIAHPLSTTSDIATQAHAVAAINGSYFDMKRGNSVCFLKTGHTVRDTTLTAEWHLRVTGAVHIARGKLKIIPWSKTQELQAERRGRATIMASGPLLLTHGKTCTWSGCDSSFVYTKHPRSAVGITREGKILLVTVDGRHKQQAKGVNIAELAHLLRILGSRDALNLDGGGSTTLWLKGAPEKGVVNYPSDNRQFDHAGERKVANILYLYR